jgi:DnaA family protein
MSSSPQILLPLESRRRDCFENFVPGPNQNVVLALHELLQASEGCVFISGPEGSGKTHLLNAAVNLARERSQQAFYIALGRLPVTAVDGLARLEEMDLVCLDDVDRVAGSRDWENTLFHFFNRFRARHGRLVVSSSHPLSSLQFQLPDLASRLAWGLRLQLEPLNDGDKKSVLQARASSLGIALPEEVADYLLSRGSRNLLSLLASLEAIRQEALSGKRKITLPLARTVLAKPGHAEDE